MTSPKYAVLAIGNAIVDVIAETDDAFIEVEGLNKGGMTLIDAERAKTLYSRMGPGREISGGSAANTLAGLANLEHKCAFIGQVAEDQLGEVFAHDIRATGIDFAVPARAADVPTARCLILVTPDAQRTMNTFLGASQFLPASTIDPQQIADAAILYVEGYMWDPQEPRAAIRQALPLARAAGRKTAFTLSDAFVIDRYRDDFLTLMAEGAIDILFANEVEITSLAQTDDFEAAVAMAAAQVPLLVVTRGERGAIAVRGDERVEVPAEPVERLVDTTGAGDLFAAGVLAGLSEGRDLKACLTMGAICAAEVISHYGARPEADLRALITARLGWTKMNAAPTKQQLVERSLERAAEQLGDITAPLMARYYAAFPAAEASFAHHGLGRRDLLETEMVGNVLYCLMTWFERPEEIRIILYDSVPHHADTLKVGADWYQGMLWAGIGLIEETLPAGAADERAAWEEMRAGLSEAIEKAQAL